MFIKKAEYSLNIIAFEFIHVNSLKPDHHFCVFYGTCLYAFSDHSYFQKYT